MHQPSQTVPEQVPMAPPPPGMQYVLQPVQEPSEQPNIQPEVPSQPNITQQFNTDSIPDYTTTTTTTTIQSTALGIDISQQEIKHKHIHLGIHGLSSKLSSQSLSDLSKKAFQATQESVYKTKDYIEAHPEITAATISGLTALAAASNVLAKANDQNGDLGEMLSDAMAAVKFHDTYNKEMAKRNPPGAQGNPIQAQVQVPHAAGHDVHHPVTPQAQAAPEQTQKQPSQPQNHQAIHRKAAPAAHPATHPTPHQPPHKQGIAVHQPPTVQHPPKTQTHQSTSTQLQNPPSKPQEQNSHQNENSSSTAETSAPAQSFQDRSVAYSPPTDQNQTQTAVAPDSQIDEPTQVLQPDTSFLPTQSDSATPFVQDDTYNIEQPLQDTEVSDDNGLGTDGADQDVNDVDIGNGVNDDGDDSD